MHSIWGLALLLALPAVQSASGMDLKAFDARCKKLLWLTGLQTKNFVTGEESHYIETGSGYQRYLRKALESARRNALRLQPVVVVEGEAPPELAQWVGELGGKVVMHELSFREHLIKLAAEQGWEYTAGLWGSYQRVDIPTIMVKVGQIVDPAEVELDYVLWTDPDVLFLDQMDSCTLPRPVYLSNGPETSKGGRDNCGVLYFNVSAYTSVFPEIVSWATEKEWKFPVVDQSLLNEFFGFRISMLPDAYDFKLYWGLPEATGTALSSAIKILHFHGPKLKLALCAMHALQNSNVDANNINITCERWNRNHIYSSERERGEALIVKSCKVSAKARDPILCLLMNAYKADRFGLYRRIFEDFYNSTHHLVP